MWWLLVCDGSWVSTCSIVIEPTLSQEDYRSILTVRTTRLRSCAAQVQPRHSLKTYWGRSSQQEAVKLYRDRDTKSSCGSIPVSPEPQQLIDSIESQSLEQFCTSHTSYTLCDILRSHSKQKKVKLHKQMQPAVIGQTCFCNGLCNFWPC